MMRHTTLISISAFLLLLLNVSYVLAQNPNSEPEPIVNERLSGFSISDNTLFWLSYCDDGEFDPQLSYIRSRPINGNIERTLHQPTTCQADSPASKTVAIDAQFAYWVTQDGRVVRLRRGASTSETPETVITSILPVGVNLVRNHSEIALDSQNIYWIETTGSTSVLYSASKMSRSRTELHTTVTSSGRLERLQVVGEREAFFLAGPPTAGKLLAHLTFDPVLQWQIDFFAINTNLVTSYAVNATTLFWSEQSIDGTTISIKLASRSNLQNQRMLLSFSRNPVPVSLLEITEMTADTSGLSWIRRQTEQGLYRFNFGDNRPILIANNTNSSINLTNDRTYLYWMGQSSTIYRLPKNATAVLLDLTGNEVPPEVIQVIQSPSQDVPLVANKTTFVRVYGRIALSSEGVTQLKPMVQLFGTRNGVPLPGSPLLPYSGNSPLQPLNQGPLRNSAIDRTKLDGSYIFRLPDSWASGTLTLQTEINGNRAWAETTYDNNSSSRTVTFTPKAPLCLDVRPVDTEFGRSIDRWSPETQQFFDRAESIWPAKLNTLWRGGGAIRQTWNNTGLSDEGPFPLRTAAHANRILDEVFRSHLFQGNPCGGNASGWIRVVMFPQEFRPSTMPLLGIANTGGTDLVSVSLFFATTTGRGPGLEGGLTLAHELGHNFGRRHIDCGGPSGVDNNYPYPACQIDFDNGPNSHIGYDPITEQLLLPTLTSDLMSYGNPVWPSDYTWNALFGRMTTTNQLRFTISNQLQDANTYLVSGFIETDTVQALNAYRLSADTLANADALIGATSDVPGYELRVYGVTNELLLNIPIRRMEHLDANDENAWAFYAKFISIESPARLEIVKLSANVVVGSFAAGINPPIVQLIEPNAGDLITSTLKAEWRGSDEDGDSINYVVRYSADDGQTWSILNSATEAISITVDASALSGSNQARIQIVASDGLHTSYTTSEVFDVARKRPEANIFIEQTAEQPLTSQLQIKQSTPLILRGRGYDAEDGPLTGNALEWEITGPITLSAIGEQLFLTDLPPGAYSVKLLVTDSDNQMGTDTWQVLVAPKVVTEATLPTLDGTCDEETYTSDLDPLALRYGDDIVTLAPFVHHASENVFYACFPGLVASASSTEYVGVWFDTDNSGGTVADVNDIGLFVGKDGIAFTTKGDGLGGFTTDFVPQGLEAAIHLSADRWGAELRIDDAVLGGWNRLVRLQIVHGERGLNLSDVVWPRQSLKNVPSSWGLVKLGDGRGDQQILFAPLPDRSLSESPFAIEATATSGLPVVYTVENNSIEVCSIDGNTVSLLGAGLCSIIASQSGNEFYYPATSVTQSFMVVDRSPDLVIAKINYKTEVRAGENLIYLLTISNTGGQTAIGVAVKDVLPALTAFVMASDGGELINGEIRWPVFDLAGGASVTRTITVKMADMLPGGGVGARVRDTRTWTQTGGPTITFSTPEHYSGCRPPTTITNTAMVTDDGANGPDPTPENNVATSTVEIIQSDVLWTKGIPNNWRLEGWVKVQYITDNGRVLIRDYQVNRSGNLRLTVTYPPVSDWPVRKNGIAQIHVDMAIIVYDAQNRIVRWLGGDLQRAPGTLGPGQDWGIWCRVNNR